MLTKYVFGKSNNTSIFPNLAHPRSLRSQILEAVINNSACKGLYKTVRTWPLKLLECNQLGGRDNHC